MDSNIDPYTDCQVPSQSDVNPTPPPQDASSFPSDVALQPVWSWKHQGSSPARVTCLEARVRSMNRMTMRVCDSIEVKKVLVRPKGHDEDISLPLEPQYVLAKYTTKSKYGAIMKEHDTGWWQLPANVDQSLLVVFAYEIPDASGAKLKPLDLDAVNKLGREFFPLPDVEEGDPDYDSHDHPLRMLLATHRACRSAARLWRAQRREPMAKHCRRPLRRTLRQRGLSWPLDSAPARSALTSSPEGYWEAAASTRTSWLPAITR